MRAGALDGWMVEIGQQGQVREEQRWVNPGRMPEEQRRAEIHQHGSRASQG